VESESESGKRDLIFISAQSAGSCFPFGGRALCRMGFAPNVLKSVKLAMRRAQACVTRAARVSAAGAARPPTDRSQTEARRLALGLWVAPAQSGTHNAAKLNNAGGIGSNPDSAIPRHLSVRTRSAKVHWEPD
jgi:hypothetical protein